MSSDALLPISQSSISDINLSTREEKSITKSEMQRTSIQSNGFSNKPRFKRNLNYFIRFFDKHPTLLTLAKLFVGLLILSSPIVMVGLYPYFSSYIYMKYYMLPFIISAGVTCGLLVLLLVYRAGDDIRSRGMLIVSWERKNILRLIHCILMMIFVIWILKSFENLMSNFSYLKEYVSQNKNKIEEYKELSLGMYWLDVFFSCFFWDKQYITLPYFDITNSFMNLLNSNISKIYNSITAIAFVYLIKLIFCKTKNEIFYFIITAMTIYESILYRIYYWSSYKAYHASSSMIYKIIELFPLLVILICALILSIKRYPIGLFKRKFATYISHKVSLFCLFIVILSFIITLGGIFFLGGAIVYLFIKVDINSTLEIEKIEFFKTLLWLGVILFTVGNSFYFGNYAFNLIFKPIASEQFPAVLKNPFYIKANLKSKRLKRFFTHSHKKKVQKVLISDD